MEFAFPTINLKAKLMALMVVLLGLTLGAELLVSLNTQTRIVEATQDNVKDLASAIQISVQELTSVGAIDRDRLQNYVNSLHTNGLVVSIASSKDLIINSSNPALIGEAIDPNAVRTVSVNAGGGPQAVPAFTMGPEGKQTVYLIPVEVEDHLLGYVQVVADFTDFARPLAEHRIHLLSVALAIFAIGLVFAYVLADRYVEPIHTVAAAAQNIAARGLEPVPEAHRRDEIGLLTRSFNEMVEQLRRAREREAELNRLERFTALGQLAGALAHEIKNPLNFISLAIDQLRARYAPQLPAGQDDFRRQLGVMKDEVHRLSELIQSFLNYGRPIEIHPAPTDIRALVRNVLELSDSKLRSQAIEASEEGDGGPVVLNVDAEKLHACFINVVANAIQAMPEGGTLRIAFRADGSREVITFSDTGAGIDPEVASHVFEPFFTTKREGIGLGLFFSRAIVERHGGSIAIGPNPFGRGTVVTFILPRAELHRQP
ncbi:MAG TPA: ATP-binding protein [Candidatus Binataceae bacterium]|nr:ATP-binding protein [Candidatus Binataceae bacterium]